MLTYLEVHLFYTIPPTILLYIISRPFINAFERFKLVVLITVAVIYTTPWDHYVIYNKAWWYRSDAVLFYIGYIPYEEYIFFVIQTVMTILWTKLCMHWGSNSFILKQKNRFNFYLIRYSVMTVVAGIVIWGWKNGTPGTKSFYLGSVCWWALPVIVGLWYGAGNYCVRRYGDVLLSILVPSLYLCYIDLIALRDRVWQINEKMIFGIIYFGDIPLEEILFFFISNTIVVIGSCAFDKSKAVIDSYRHLLFGDQSKSDDGNLFTQQFFMEIMKGFTTNEIDLPDAI